jgi:predicted dehydrogenase
MRRAKSSSKIRYAIVGLGHISQVAVLPAFAHARKNSELVALISSDPKKLRVLGKRYGVSLLGSYEDIGELCSEGMVDAAYIAVPNHLHLEMTRTVAKLGIHVLCEKPMAMTVRDCESMISVTEENDVKLMIAYRLHFEEANLDAIQRIRKGEIGEPHVFSSVFCHQVREGDIRTRKETGGGALYDLGVYCVNAARYLFGAEPKEVSAVQLVGTEPRFAEVDATTTALLKFPDDRVAQFTVSQGAADIGEYRVVGSKGDIRLDPAYEYAGDLKEYVTIDGKTKNKTFPKSDQFAPQLVYFSECILHDRKPEPSGEEGLADVRVLEAIAEAARTGKSVELGPFSRDKRPSGRQAIRKPPVRKPETVHAEAPSK